jgi:hypothetical protein
MMNICPCCDSVLLRHIYKTRTTWFCLHCRQEMPNFQAKRLVNLHKEIPVKREIVSHF